MLTCFDQLQIIARSGYSYNCSIELINKCALVLFVNVSCWSMFVESSTFLLIHNQWYLIVSSLWCGFVHNVCDAVCDGTRSTSLTLFSTMYSDYWFGDRLATRGTEKNSGQDKWYIFLLLFNLACIFYIIFFLLMLVFNSLLSVILILHLIIINSFNLTVSFHNIRI